MADSATRTYDLLYIIRNKYAENEVPAVIKTVNDLVVKHKGSVITEINYGKRRLAYPVKHEAYGNYVLVRTEMAGADAHALNKTLRVQEEVLRHLITNTLKTGDVPQEADLKQVELPPQPAAKEASPVMRTHKRQSIVDVAATPEEQEKLKKGSSFDVEKELGVTAKEAEESLKDVKKEEPTKSVDMKELDTKLDEIMKDFE
ncbi:MAG: 30S ribosomal protein S6 [Parcubacteria group bacterium]|nr:30S ribosomal protein S6 [Parcubacteria group bacterium]